MDILATDRAQEFRRYYEPDPKRKLLGYGTYVIQDYLKGVKPGHWQLEDFDSEDQPTSRRTRDAALAAANCQARQKSSGSSVLGRFFGVWEQNGKRRN